GTHRATEGRRGGGAAACATPGRARVLDRSMRRLLPSLGVLLTLCAPTAQATPLKLRELASSAVPAVAAPSGSLAYLASPTQLTVQRGGTAAQTWPVPAGCVPQAIGDGVVALGCRLSLPRTRVLDESTGAVVDTPEPRLPGGSLVESIAAIGAR